MILFSCVPSSQDSLANFESLSDEELDAAFQDNEGSALAGQAAKTPIQCSIVGENLVLSRGNINRSLPRFFCSAREGNAQRERICGNSGYSSTLTRCENGCDVETGRCASFQPCVQNEVGLTTLNSGESCSYEVDGVTYEIMLEEIIYEEIPGYDLPQPIAKFRVNTPTQTIIQNVSPRKFFRIENIFTIETPNHYVVPRADYRFKLHRAVPIDEMEIYFDRSCTDAFFDLELINKCNELVNNYRDLVFPAIEQVSGLNIGECFDEISINILAESGTAGANTAGFRLYIGIGEDLIRNINVSTWGNYEVHEALHVHNSCANIPAEEDFNHFYYFLREAEIYQELGNELIATQKFDNARTMYENVEASPTMLDNEMAMWGGCHGIKTHLLQSHYIETDETLVREFYSRIIPEKDLLNELNDNSVFNRAVAEILGNSSEVISQINDYCSSSHAFNKTISYSSKK